VTSVTTKSGTVFASALINGQLFVTRYTQAGYVEVYDTTSLKLLRSIPIAGLGNYLYGIATDATKNNLHISD